MGLDIGNVAGSNDLCFEIAPKNEHDEKEKDSKGLKVPIQVQINYTKPNGMKCCRVITERRRVTTRRSKSEKEVDVSVVSVNACQQVR
jgi:hypothetical protein